MHNRPTIFADHAPRYHAAGLPVIPLHSGEKRPIIDAWQRYAELKVDEETSRKWLEMYPTANIGLPLGKSSGLIMIDIDTDDAKVYDAIMSVLPPSPWHRKGKKGMMLAYRWAPIKTCRIRNLSNESIVEILSSRTQCVLPPSIHPDTKKAYTSNVELLDVLQNIVSLPDDIEIKLRQAIAAAGVQLSLSGSSRVTEYVSPGSRDTSLTEMAGLFAYAVVRGERTLKESIGMLSSYHEEFVENTAGDLIPLEKHIDNLIKFLHRDVLDKGKILPLGWDSGFTPEELKALGVTLTSEDTEWDYDTIISYLQDQFQLHPESDPLKKEAIEKTLLRISKSVQISKIDVDRIFKYIVDVSGIGVKLPTLRARLKELKAGDILGTNHSEIAQAVAKDLEVIGLFRFHGSKVMKWGGSHWAPYDNNLIKLHISNRYGHLEACKKNNDINGILSMMSYVLPSGIQVRPVSGINFSNGFLTQELKLVPHDPDYGMTYTLPFRYIPEEAGRFPLFDEFITRCWGRDPDFKEKVKALQEAMCVTLFGMGSRFQRAILLHGAPASGKTQLLRIIDSMVPHEARCAVPPDEWGDRFLPAQLHNKILNVCGELSDTKFIDGQRFKDIITGEEMSAQHKNLPIFQFKPSAVTHWFASNHLPKTRDTSRGFIRRWLMLTFHYPVKPEEKKIDIGDHIASEEREAIVAWAALAMPRLLEKNDYTLPQSHLHLENEFSNINNSVRFFLKESGKVRLGVHGGFANEVNLYNSYWAFCLGAGGTKAVGSTTFRAMMRELTAELGFRLNISQGRFGSTEARYDGIAVVA